MNAEWKGVCYFTRKLPVKSDGKISGSEHLYCSMVILFLTRLFNPSTDIFEVKTTENSDFKKIITN
jgi:hypothetical protein